MLQRTVRLAPLAVLFACTHNVPNTDAQSAFGGSNGTPTSGGRTSVGGTSASGGSNNALQGGSTNAGASTQGGNAGAVSVGNGGSVAGGGVSNAGASAVGGASAGAAGAPPDAPGVVAAPFHFPQNFRSSNCKYPSQARASDAQSEYATWKTKLVTTDGAGGFHRVLRPDNNEGNTTVSEGIGYGMILTVVMDDQALFDDFWKYSQKYVNQNGLMNWRVQPDGTEGMDDLGAATDADEDMAWALALADKKWGGQGSLGTPYLTLAKAQIDRIWNHEIDHTRGQMVLAGDSWGPTIVYNPSYFAPNEYRLFARISGNSDWNTVVDKGYSMLSSMLNSANGNADNGLVPAWTNDSAQPSPAFMGAPTNYQYDAVRVPFRIAEDYCDFGEPRAKAYLAKIATFFTSVGAANIVDGYALNGSPQPQNPGMQSALFVGAPGVAAMSDPAFAPLMNDAYGLLSTKQMLPPSYYFNLSWQVFSLLMTTGNLFDYTLH